MKRSSLSEKSLEQEHNAERGTRNRRKRFRRTLNDHPAGAATDDDPPSPPPFEPGDHITFDYKAIAGTFLPYQHHAIVISVGAHHENESSAAKNEWTMCIVDFAAEAPPNNDGKGEQDDNTINSINSSRSGTTTTTAAATTGIVKLLLKHCTDSFIVGPENQNPQRQTAATITRKDTPPPSDGNTEEASSLKPKERQPRCDQTLRIHCVSTNGWRKVQYMTIDDALSDSTQIVLRRVEFLLQNPQYIPTYNLIESNCECVAVWCKTGKWQTIQAQEWLKTIGEHSRTAIDATTDLISRKVSSASSSSPKRLLVAAAAGAAAAVYAVPSMALAAAAAAGGGTAASVVATEVVSKSLSVHAKRTWEEQTQLLNDAFQQYHCHSERSRESRRKDPVVIDLT